MAFFMGSNKITIEEIKFDAEVIRLKDLMRTTAIALNDRIKLLMKENNITADWSPLSEVFPLHSTS